MKITYDWKKFTFSDISMDEFRAIREFMKLAKLTASEHVFKGEQFNTSDEKLNKLGGKLTEQIKDVLIAGI